MKSHIAELLVTHALLMHQLFMCLGHAHEPHAHAPHAHKPHVLLTEVQRYKCRGALRIYDRIIKEFRCCEVKIEESEKAGSRWESNPDTSGLSCQCSARCATEAFSPTCAVHIEDCEGWWLSGCRSSVAEHWLNKPGVLGSTPGNCWLFHFLPHNI